jgi:hypothetical protein
LSLIDLGRYCGCWIHWIGESVNEKREKRETRAVAAKPIGLVSQSLAGKSVVLAKLSCLVSLR